MSSQTWLHTRPRRQRSPSPADTDSIIDLTDSPTPRRSFIEWTPRKSEEQYHMELIQNPKLSIVEYNYTVNEVSVYGRASTVMTLVSHPEWKYKRGSFEAANNLLSFVYRGALEQQTLTCVMMELIDVNFQGIGWELLNSGQREGRYRIDCIPADSDAMLLGIQHSCKFCNCNFGRRMMAGA